MQKHWIFHVDGKTYEIEYKKVMRKLTVNGEIHKLKSQSMLRYVVDYPISQGENDIRFVAVGNKADIVINGRYKESGEVYKPLPPEKMIEKFAAASIIAGGAFCGLVGAVTGGAFWVIFIKLGLPDKKASLLAGVVICGVLQLLCAGIVAGQLNLLLSKL